MAWITIDLWGDEPEETTPSKKEVKLAPEKTLRYDEASTLQKQVSNINGQVVPVVLP